VQINSAKQTNGGSEGPKEPAMYADIELYIA